MANRTWMQATNSVLGLSSLPLIADADAFNNDDELEKYHSQAKQFVLLTNHHLALRARKHFNSERFEFDCTPGTANYDLATGLAPENIKLHTFFNISTGTKAAQNGRLMEMSYKRYMDLYPDPTKITPGVPTHWVVLPRESDEQTGEPVNQIKLVPTPDLNYKIEFQAILHVQELTDADSKILFPYHYEHALWEMAWQLLEVSLGEGKEGNIAALAREAANAVFLASGKHPDGNKAPRSMKMRGMRMNPNFIRSPLSVDENGNLTGV